MGRSKLRAAVSHQCLSGGLTLHSVVFGGFLPFHTAWFPIFPLSFLCNHLLYFNLLDRALLSVLAKLHLTRSALSRFVFLPSDFSAWHTESGPRAPIKMQFFDYFRLLHPGFLFSWEYEAWMWPWVGISLVSVFCSSSQPSPASASLRPTLL